MSRIFKVDEKPIVSEDGNVSLTLIGADSSRDGGGHLYRFEILKPSYVQGPLTGNVLIGDVTSFAADIYYEKRIKNYQDLKFLENMRLYSDYSNKFGCIYLVKRFDKFNFDINTVPDSQIIEISELICRIYIMRYSGYKLNNSDTSADPQGFYTDKIEFSPMELPPSFRKVVTAEEVFGA